MTSYARALGSKVVEKTPQVADSKVQNWPALPSKVKTPSKLDVVNDPKEDSKSVDSDEESRNCEAAYERKKAEQQRAMDEEIEEKERIICEAERLMYRHLSPFDQMERLIVRLREELVTAPSQKNNTKKYITEHCENTREENIARARNESREVREMVQSRTLHEHCGDIAKITEFLTVKPHPTSSRDYGQLVWICSMCFHVTICFYHDYNQFSILFAPQLINQRVPMWKFDHLTNGVEPINFDTTRETIAYLNKLLALERELMHVWK